MEAVQKCMALCQRDGTVEYCIRYYLRQYSTDDPVPYPEPEDAPKLLCSILVPTIWNDYGDPVQLSDLTPDQFQKGRIAGEKGRKQCHAHRCRSSSECYLKGN